MVNLSSEQSLQPQSWERVPPLENGDRLTSHEFTRRYLATSQIKKAELIEGTVYVASPLLKEVGNRNKIMVVSEMAESRYLE